MVPYGKGLCDVGQYTLGFPMKAVLGKHVVGDTKLFSPSATCLSFVFSPQQDTFPDTTSHPTSAYALDFETIH